MRRIGTLLLAISMLLALLIVPIPATVSAEGSTGLKALNAFPVEVNSDGLMISEANGKDFTIGFGNNMSMKTLFFMRFNATEKTYSLTKPYGGEDWTDHATALYSEADNTVILTFDEALQNHLADKLLRIGREKGWSEEYSYAFWPGDGSRELTEATATMNGDVITLDNLDVLETELILKNGADVMLKLVRPDCLEDFAVVENPADIRFTLGKNNQFFYVTLDLKDTTMDYDAAQLTISTNKRDIPLEVEQFTVTYIHDKRVNDVIKEETYNAGTLIVPDPDDFARLGYKVYFEYRPDPRENWKSFPSEGVVLTENLVISVEYTPDASTRGDFFIALKTGNPINLERLHVSAKYSNDVEFTIDSKTLPASAVVRGKDYVVFHFTDVPVGPYRNIIVTGMSPVRTNFSPDNFNFGGEKGAFVREIGGEDTKLLILTDRKNLEPVLTVDLAIAEAGIEGQLVDPNATYTAELDAYILPSSLSRFVKTTPYTHNFVGWDLDGEALDKQPVTLQSKTLTVTYEALPETPETTVTFVPNNGDDNFTKVLPASYKLDYVLHSVASPRKAGYSFAGWFLDEACTARPNPDQGLTEDITLYAKYEKLEQMRTVSFSFKAEPTSFILNQGDYTFTLSDKETGQQWTDADFEFSQDSWGKNVVKFNRKLNHGEYLLTMTKERGVPTSSSAKIVDGVTTYNITLSPSTAPTPRDDYFQFEYRIDEGFTLKLYEKKFEKYPATYSDPRPVNTDLNIDLPSHNGWTVGQNREAIDEHRPVVEGYRYLGVGSDSDWNHTLYEDTEVLKSSGSNNFARIAYFFVQVFNLQVELNGGKVDGDMKTEYVIGEELELPTPSRAYSVFRGWFLDAEGTLPLPEHALYEKDMTVYALWDAEAIIPVPEGADDADKPEGYVTLTFDVGEHATVTDGFVKFYINPQADIRFEQIDVPLFEVQIGYEFTGWSIPADTVLKTDHEAVAQIKQLADIIPVDGPAERPNGYVLVTFDAGDHGTISGHSQFYVNPTAGKTFGDLEAPSIRMEIGYRFVRWNRTTTDIIDKDMTVRPIYEKLAPVIPIAEFVGEKPEGYHRVVFVIDETEGTLRGNSEYYVLDGFKLLKTYAPRIMPADGYEITDVDWEPQMPLVIAEDTVFTAQVRPIVLPEIIPADHITERPEGYITVVFAPDTEAQHFKETSVYYVKIGTTVTEDIAPRTLVDANRETVGDRLWDKTFPMEVSEDLIFRLVTDWRELDGKIYYYREGMPVTGYQVIEGASYLFNGKGIRVDGWHVVNGITMYFDTMTGKRLFGRQQIGNTVYYLTSIGKLTGWHRLNSKDYYFDPHTGGLLTGKRTIGKTTYLLASDGNKLYGWHLLSGKKYYFDPQFGGGMITGLRKVDNGTYYFRIEDSAAGANDQGSALTHGSITINDIRYYFNGNGLLTKID